MHYEAQLTTDPVQHELASRRRKACANCRRRKERCDGLDPCGRCRRRRVEDECRQQRSVCHPPSRHGKRDAASTDRRPSVAGSHDSSAPTARTEVLESRNGLNSTSTPLLPLSASRGVRPVLSSVGSIVLHTYPLICGNQGAYVVLGPSANLSLLQSIQRIVLRTLGPCPFTEERPESDLLDGQPLPFLNPIDKAVEPQRPSAENARYYLHWYAMATSCVFDLYDPKQLAAEIIPWLQQPVAADATSCIYFLVLAIGAQCAPDDDDVSTDSYFIYGQYLASTRFFGATNYLTIQIFCLIAMYFLNAARPIAAKTHLSVAIQAAHTLGIHQADLLGLFPPEEASKRERLWKVLRVLDLFLSTQLGQRASTSETRNTMSQSEYSASTDLCYIFEKILVEIYAKQEVSPTILQHVSKHHREWASHFRAGLLADRISAEESVGTDNDQKLPNIGLCHLKEAYYWTILLVTRPYLLDLVQKRVADESHPLPAITTTSSTTNNASSSVESQSPSDILLAHASVNSAVLTIDLLQGLLTAEKIPKRLPYMINSIFNAALILGMGFFADLNSLFPLGRAMRLAEELLGRFQSHDALARWSLRIVQDLHNACDELMKRRCESQLKHQRTLVEDVFGDVKSSSSCSGVQLFYPTPSSPRDLSQRMQNQWSNESVQQLGESPSAEFLSSLQLQENSAIWDQLFCNDTTDPLCETEPVQGSQVLSLDWM